MFVTGDKGLTQLQCLPLLICLVTLLSCCLRSLFSMLPFSTADLRHFGHVQNDSPISSSSCGRQGRWYHTIHRQHLDMEASPCFRLCKQPGTQYPAGSEDLSDSYLVSMPLSQNWWSTCPL